MFVKYLEMFHFDPLKPANWRLSGAVRRRGARRNMAEPTQFSFDLKELTTALTKQQGLREGLGWLRSISVSVRA
jgi:hypothetical protein